MKYIDRYGLYNIRPVKKDLIPTGNDGWILTVYAYKVGLTIDISKVFDSYKELPFIGKIPTQRLPYKLTPYPSRDVILGWASLGLLKVNDLVDSNWSFSPLPLERFKIIDTLYQFLDLRNKDRNYFWQHEYKQVYRFAFSVPFQDRAYLYRVSGKKAPLAWRVYEKLSRRVKPKNDSSKLLAWLKYNEVPSKEVWVSYFGKDHPITLKALDIYYK